MSANVGAPQGFLKAGGELKELGLGTVEDLLGWSRQSLVQRFGERQGGFLHQACRGNVSLHWLPVGS